MKKIILIFLGFSVFSFAQDLKKETEKKQFPAEVQSENLKEVLETYEAIFTYNDELIKFIEDFREDFKKEANDFFDFVLLNEKALPSPGTAER